jgi:hypothetical protein
MVDPDGGAIPTEWEERRAGTIMRQQGRRSWLVPLLAVPITRVLAAEIPPELLPAFPDELDEAREAGRRIAEAVVRLTADPAADLTDADAAYLIRLAVGSRWALTNLFAFLPVTAVLAGVDPGLSGRGLIQAVATRVGDRDTDPVQLAPLVAVLLDNAADDRRDFVPTADDYFLPVARAFDRRCFAAGMRSWADALRRAERTWTPEAWSRLVSAALAGSVGHSVMRATALFAETVAQASEAERPATPRANPSRRDRERQHALERERDEARRLAETAQQDAATARQREAELIAARDRAQARVRELSADLEQVRQARDRAEKEVVAHRATVNRLMGRPEPAVPAPVPEPVPPADLLRGRTVFFFTGQARAAAREAQASAIRSLGPENLRLYDMRSGRPGPEVFPPGAVVVVDTTFVQHKHTDELETRIRRSDVTYILLKAGQGGLAARLAMALGWSPEPG